MYDYTKVKTLKQAYKKHPDKIDIERVEKVLKFLPERFRRGMIATLNGEVFTEVINNNDPNVPVFEPDYNDPSQKKWGPWCLGGESSGSGFRYDVDDWTGAGASSSGGARLALRDQPRLQHVKTHRPDIYKEFFLKLK